MFNICVVTLIIVHTHIHVRYALYEFNLKYQLIHCLLDSFTTTDAPWNVTQWIDPLDPHPKITSVPVLVIIRK